MQLLFNYRKEYLDKIVTTYCSLNIMILFISVHAKYAPKDIWLASKFYKSSYDLVELQKI